MKLRSFYYLLATAVLILLLIGAGGFYWIWTNSPLSRVAGGSVPTPEAAIFVSKQAPAMASWLVKPDDLQALRQLQAPPSQRRQLRREFEQLQRSLLANTDLDYQRDLKPWLGDEITLAMMTPDLDRDAENGTQPGYLLALATQDGERSREFLDLFWQKRAVAGEELTFESYKGVRIIYNKSAFSPTPDRSTSNSLNPFNPKGSNAWVTATVGNRFVLFANHPKVLHQAIDNVQAPDLNLAASSQYQQAIDRLKGGELGLLFVNLPQLTAWLGSEIPRSIPQPSDNLAIALGLKSTGIFADAVWLADENAPIAPALVSEPVAALRYVPQNSAVVASGRDLNRLWQQLSATFASNPLLAELTAQPLDRLQSQWDIDLEEEIFSWADGEYALALLPRAERKSADWLFVTEKSDAAEAAIARLDQFAKDRGESVGPFTLRDERRIVAWTELIPSSEAADDGELSTLRLNARVRGVHAQTENYELIASSIETITRAFDAARGRSELQQPRFVESLEALPTPNQGYLYIDWSNGEAILERQLPIVRILEFAGKPFFEHLRSLVVSGSDSESGIRHARLFFRFM